MTAGEPEVRAKGPDDARSKPVVRPIQVDDVAAVSGFLHHHLNTRVTPEAWARLLTPPWPSPADNRGFQLVHDGRIVGAYAAVYSTRERGGETVRVCNLAAFCVLEGYRTQSLLLVRAMLKQKGYVFTDLSPSGNVVAMNERLGFQRLDTATQLTVNLPRPPRRGIRISQDPDAIARAVTGDDARIFADHRDAPAAQHLVVTDGDRYAYLMFRTDRRKGLPVFATPLHVGGDRKLLERSWGSVASRLLTSHGLVATLAERRVLGFSPRVGVGVELKHPRPRMFRGDGATVDDVDYLYSELTLVRW